MSATPEYRALNGQEIRKIILREIEFALDKIAMLKPGLTFHRAKIQWGFKMTAYPGEVPVPKPFEDNFIAQHPEFEVEKFLAVERALADLKAQRAKLIAKGEELLKQLDDKIAEAEKHEEHFGIVDAGKESPDSIRRSHNLSIKRIERTGVQVAEVDKTLGPTVIPNPPSEKIIS